jgi:transposase
MRKLETSNDDRNRIINAYLQAIPPDDISNTLKIPINTIKSIIRIYVKTGRIKKLKRGSSRVKKHNHEQLDTLKSWIDENCTITQNKLVEKVKEVFKIQCSHTTINNYIDGFNYSLKKISLIPERRNNFNAIFERCVYAQKYLELIQFYREDQFIFIDEFGVSISTRIGRGRSKRGFRAVEIVPNIRTKNISVCAAMNSRGVLYF